MDQQRRQMPTIRSNIDFSSDRILAYSYNSNFQKGVQVKQLGNYRVWAVHQNVEEYYMHTQ